MVVPVEVSWRRYGADGGPPLPPQPDPQGLVPMHFLNQQLRRGKDGGRVRYANRGGRNAVYHLAMRKLKGKGEGEGGLAGDRCALAGAHGLGGDP